MPQTTDTRSSIWSPATDRAIVLLCPGCLAQEVIECKWISLDQLRRDMSARPEEFTIWFREEIQAVDFFSGPAGEGFAEACAGTNDRDNSQPDCRVFPCRVLNFALGGKLCASRMQAGRETGMTPLEPPWLREAFDQQLNLKVALWHSRGGALAAIRRVVECPEYGIVEVQQQPCRNVLGA
jgi:hypothetical protein